MTAGTSATVGVRRRGRRTLPALACALALGLAAGCGDSGTPAPADAGTPQPAGTSVAGLPFVTLEEAATLLRREGVRAQRLAPPAAVSRGATPSPVDVARYATQGGEQFELLAFLTPDDARQALPSVRGARGIEAAVAHVNVVAGFPDGDGHELIDGVGRVLARLDAACSQAGGDADLRRLCFAARAPAKSAPHSGGPRPAAMGSTLRLDGFSYTPVLSRVLNPGIEADARLVADERPPGGRQWFAVFLRVCNLGSAPAAVSDDLALLTSDGRRTRPEPPAAEGAFAHPPRRLAGGACAPESTTSGDRLLQRAALVFDVPRDPQRLAPLVLEIRAGGQRARVRLDV
jgi:hypothetical protein